MPSLSKGERKEIRSGQQIKGSNVVSGIIRKLLLCLTHKRVLSSFQMMCEGCTIQIEGIK